MSATPQRSYVELKEQLFFIKQHLTFRQVFTFYGRPWAGDFTHQYACDLHGDGRDKNPSARYYHDTKLVKCYACEDGNNGGDVCWYIKKREKFRHYSDVLAFVQKHFGLAYEASNLSHRIALADQQLSQVSMKDVLKKQVYNEINDRFFAIEQRLKLGQRPRFNEVQHYVWSQARFLETFEGKYLEFAKAIDFWKKWALEVLVILRKEMGLP
jgi:hypothetical protein